MTDDEAGLRAKTRIMIGGGLADGMPRACSGAGGCGSSAMAAASPCQQRVAQ